MLKTANASCAMCLLLLALSSCREAEDPELLEVFASWKALSEPTTPPLLIRYPLPETVYPADMRSPIVDWEWERRSQPHWFVTIRVPSMDTRYTARPQETQWSPRREDWTAIIEALAGTNEEAFLSVVAISRRSPARVLAADTVSFRISAHPVGAPLVYRLVPLPLPPPSRYDEVEWRKGTVSSYDEPDLLLTGLNACLNCHSVSADGSHLAFDINYDDHDRSHYVIAEVGPEVHLSKSNTFSWNEFRGGPICPSESLCTAGATMPSPDGRYFISEVLVDDNVISPRADKWHSLQGATVLGILAFYDTTTGEVTPLPGADSPDYVHAFPWFFPDGERIVLARAPVREELLGWTHERREKMLSLDLDDLLKAQHLQLDLYTMPFNEGRGGVPQPLPGAHDNGKNNYAPRVSPDGKWIVFRKSETGTFVPPDSDLYIIPAEGGEARRLSCSSDTTDSGHTWSPNSRWLAFVSKRDSPYTNLYLTHIDEDGNDSPAILLSHFRKESLAVNLPEFFPIQPGDLQRLHLDEALDVYLMNEEDSSDRPRWGPSSL